MNRDFVIPGPETVIWWGVHVPLLSAVFGIAGICLGHLMAPGGVPPLAFQRQIGVIVAGVLLSLGITIATGQRPFVVLGWSIGIGFSGITIFQTLARQVAAAARRSGGDLIAQVAERLGRHRSDAGQVDHQDDGVQP